MLVYMWPDIDAMKDFAILSDVEHALRQAFNVGFKAINAMILSANMLCRLVGVPRFREVTSWPLGCR